MSVGKVLNDIKPFISMILLQVGFAGMYVVAVASMKKGLSHYILVVYRNIFATLFMAPFALYFERNTRPKLTLKIFLKITALAVFEPVLDQNFYYMGANYTSAGFASALVNMLPAITFVMATILGIERVKVKERRSQAKIIGTMITVAGALLMILYTGPAVPFPWTKPTHHNSAESAHNGNHRLTGTLMVIFSAFCWGGFFILQSNVLKSYPSEMTLTTLICLMGALLNGAITLVAEKGNMKPWAIGFDMRLFTCVYAGIVCSGVAYYVQGLVMKQRGPVFVTAFNPLCMIITALLGSFILREQITLGSVLGAIIIVSGLYALIWGKGKDHLDKFSDSGANELPLSTVHDCKHDSDHHHHTKNGHFASTKTNP
ncbi:WAT1-related protein [Rhynchospora pubera]|uniref:WAT1-related protein n=1 Tax=Rhynchospora pubera TaxID=906938 RepID=A0AAV8CD04_9POAL|nr:WAT1-related protein [Rhynchospora pubera]KAJ4764920.1 WAT1-related protein [Rhynchospora pubera]